MENITLQTTILKPVHEVWEYFTQPEHITNWNFATEEWHCPSAESDFQEGGTFSYRMEAKDGSFGFDYKGTFDEIVPNIVLKYHLEDGRNVEVRFRKIDESTTEVVESFEPDANQPEAMQREGWSKILYHFEKYCEGNS